MTDLRAENAARGERARALGRFREGRHNTRTTFVFRRSIRRRHREALRVVATGASGKLHQSGAPGRLRGTRERGS